MWNISGYSGVLQSANEEPQSTKDSQNTMEYCRVIRVLQNTEEYLRVHWSMSE